MKLDNLFRMSALLIAVSMISGCGSSGSNNPSNVFNGAVFISDRDAIGVTDELFIADSDGVVVTKLSPDAMAGNVTSFLVSPNRGFIAYLADPEDPGVNELYYLKKTTDSVGVLGVETPVKINPDISFPSQSVTGYQWSPNGRFIAYIADQDSVGMQQLFISDAVSVINVTPAGLTGDVADIKWSPDSNNIVFKAPIGFGDEVFVSKGDAFDADAYVAGVQVSNSLSGIAVIDYEWSPDSSLIAYMSDQDDAGVIDLYTTTVNALVNTRVTDPLITASVQAFLWPNNNSTFLAYSAINLSGDTDLYVTQLALANVLPVSNVIAGGEVKSFLWAPNNSLLAYVADQTVDETFELYTTLPDGTETGTKRSKDLVGAGSGIDTITTDGFVWSPFSNQLIYRAEDTSGVFELFTSTVDGVALTEGVKISATLVALGNVNSDFQVSPFGNAVTYIADQEEDEVFELYATDLIGTITPIRVSANLSGTQDVFQHDWSSDGTKVFYIADETLDGVNDVYTGFISGTTSVNLSNNLPATGSVTGALVDAFGVTETLASP